MWPREYDTPYGVNSWVKGSDYSTGQIPRVEYTVPQDDILQLKLRVP